jgi:hypothetical protein
VRPSEMRKRWPRDLAFFRTFKTQVKMLPKRKKEMKISLRLTISTKMNSISMKESKTIKKPI